MDLGIYCSCGVDPGEEHKPYCQLVTIARLQKGANGGVTGDSELESLRTQLTAALAERDEARERVEELEVAASHTACPECRDVWKSRIDTAWQQGAEAFREAAASACKLRKRGRDAIEVIEEAIRALPVPERKEG